MNNESYLYEVFRIPEINGKKFKLPYLILTIRDEPVDDLHHENGVIYYCEDYDLGIDEWHDCVDWVKGDVILYLEQLENDKDINNPYYNKLLTMMELENNNDNT